MYHLYTKTIELNEEDFTVIAQGEENPEYFDTLHRLGLDKRDALRIRLNYGLEESYQYGAQEHAEMIALAEALFMEDYSLAELLSDFIESEVLQDCSGMGWVECRLPSADGATIYTAQYSFKELM